MDRERLSDWLESPHRTWRWNDGEDSERYEGVSTSDEGLKWFRWSHVFADDTGEGEHDVETQSFSAFRKSGPARQMPEGKAAELAHWVSKHAPEGPA